MARRSRLAPNGVAWIVIGVRCVQSSAGRLASPTRLQNPERLLFVPLHPLSGGGVRRFPEVLAAFLEGMEAAGLSLWRTAVSPQKGAAREDGAGEEGEEEGGGSDSDDGGEGSETLRPPEHGQLAVRLGPWDALASRVAFECAGGWGARMLAVCGERSEAELTTSRSFLRPAAALLEEGGRRQAIRARSALARRRAGGSRGGLSSAFVGVTSSRSLFGRRWLPFAAGWRRSRSCCVGGGTRAGVPCGRQRISGP